VGGAIYHPICLIGEIGADLFDPVVPDQNIVTTP
jgi:hypothetical protein